MEELESRKNRDHPDYNTAKIGLRSREHQWIPFYQQNSMYMIVRFKNDYYHYVKNNVMFKNDYYYYYYYYFTLYVPTGELN